MYVHGKTQMTIKEWYVSHFIWYSLPLFKPGKKINDAHQRKKFIILYLLIQSVRIQFLLHPFLKYDQISKKDISLPSFSFKSLTFKRPSLSKPMLVVVSFPMAKAPTFICVMWRMWSCKAKIKSLGSFNLLHILMTSGIFNLSVILANSFKSWTTYSISSECCTFRLGAIQIHQITSFSHSVHLPFTSSSSSGASSNKVVTQVLITLWKVGEGIGKGEIWQA